MKKINYIKRNIEPQIKRLAKYYPVIFLTGPRQSGKSTMLKSTFPDYQYINLEEPATKKQANIDPTGFIQSLTKPTIIDEAQNAPEIFSSIQVRVDNEHIDGFFILSGSQNFVISKKIGQTLAGRVGIAELMPLSYKEINSHINDSKLPNAQNLNNKKSSNNNFAMEPQIQGMPTVTEIMLKGSYPAIYNRNIDSQMFYKNYISTYVKRDVSDIMQIKNKTQFNKFIQLCAARCGNLINYSELASKAGITIATAKSWLSILVQSYIVFFLQPYYENPTKRLTKTPKLYFYDTGLLAYLTGLFDSEQYFFATNKGAIFENFVISEMAKHHFNANIDSQMYFYRDDSKIEVDLYDCSDKTPIFAEIKSSQTYNSKFARSVKKIGDELRIQNGDRFVIYSGTGKFNDGKVTVFGIKEWLEHVD